MYLYNKPGAEPQEASEFVMWTIVFLLRKF